jgi:predicted NAD/FAD-binding protein
VTLPGPQGSVTHGVDTGFLVFNERTYPNLIRLFKDLRVECTPSDMSFSVQVPKVWKDQALEWSGSSLKTVFAQKRNLFNPRFWSMLTDLLRFNAITTRIAATQQESALQQPLVDFLRQYRFGSAFRDWYFLPMLGCIWSCPTDQMLQFPVSTMIRFCYNHGLIQVTNRPQWWTVTGGARHYVEKIIAHIDDKRLNTPVHSIEREADGVRISSGAGVEQFDYVVLATHADQSLALLAQPTQAEAATLGAIRYHPNRAVLHTDTSVLPQEKSAWAAWNYERAVSADRESAGVCLHYLINQLQPIPFEQPVIVSLNPLRPIAYECVLGTYDYAHPVFDMQAIAAQKEVSQLQGHNRTWFCGAWTGYGFHEDGLKSGFEVARRLLASTSLSSVGVIA